MRWPEKNYFLAEEQYQKAIIEIKDNLKRVNLKESRNFMELKLETKNAGKKLGLEKSRTNQYRAYTSKRLHKGINKHWPEHKLFLNKLINHGYVTGIGSEGW